MFLFFLVPCFYSIIFVSVVLFSEFIYWQYAREKIIVHILGVFLDLSVGELYFVIILIWACGYFSAVYIFLHAIIWAWVCFFFS